MVAPLVVQHYSQSGLAARLLDALAAAGKNLDALTREDLAQLEEFHVGGREATRELATLAGVKAGMQVLDIGCGIGGPARTLAAEFGCEVTGIDLVDDYVQTAVELTRRVGLAARVTYRQADALALPFADETFDAVITEHVTMNIEAKDRLFAEVRRVLRSGGSYALYEICGGDGSPLAYPVPWATTGAISFLLSPAALKTKIEDTPFAVAAWKDVSTEALQRFKVMVDAAAARPADALPAPGLSLIMGREAVDKIRNLLGNLQAGRVRVVMAVAHKAG
jgi:ubiquinone/menaquinone biosynthesis C-methylase UbiE